MIIKNVLQEDLKQALAKVNKDFDDNICWNRFEGIRNGFIVTLAVRNSHGKGARLGFQISERTGQRRHLINACWHVHGHFFDALLEINPKADITTCISHIYKHEDRVIGNWEDKQIGSMMDPLYASEACECGD